MRYSTTTVVVQTVTSNGAHADLDLVAGDSWLPVEEPTAFLLLKATSMMEIPIYTLGTIAAVASEIF